MGVVDPNFRLEFGFIKSRVEQLTDTNFLKDIRITFHVRFPDGEDGDKARERLPSAMARSHDRLCTVTQTVTRGTPVEVALDEG